VRDLGPGPYRRWLVARYGEMAAAADSIGADFGVVAFPHVGQIEGADDGRVQRQLVELGREHGWPVIDLTPAFRAASQTTDQRSLMFDLWHPGAEGHRVAAVATAEWLERARLLP
jgi:hypothetical protein